MNENLSILLNVGGSRFTTSLSTLRRFPDSMLGSMFSGNHTTPQMSDGSYFIDRDGTHFRHILNFLRQPTDFVCDFLSANEEDEIRKEATFYCLDNVMFPSHSTVPTGLCDVANERATIVQNCLGVYCQKTELNSKYPNQLIPMIVCTSCDTAYMPYGVKTGKGVISSFSEKVNHIPRQQPTITTTTGCLACLEHCGSIPSQLKNIDSLFREQNYTTNNIYYAFKNASNNAICIAELLTRNTFQESSNRTILYGTLMTPLSTDPADVLITRYHPTSEHIQVHREAVLVTGINMIKIVGGAGADDTFVLDELSCDKIKRTEMYNVLQEKRERKEVELVSS